MSGGPLKLHGLLGWFSWLFIHIAFLTGFRNRVGALLTWWVAFTRDIRRERAFTDKPVGLLQKIYAPTEGQSGLQTAGAGSLADESPDPGSGRPDTVVAWLGG